MDVRQELISIIAEHPEICTELLKAYQELQKQRADKAE